MTITVQNQVARAEFSQVAMVSAETISPGVSLEFDADGNVVAASFDSHGGAARLVRTLARCKLALSENDADNLLSTF